MLLPLLLNNLLSDPPTAGDEGVWCVVGQGWCGLVVAEGFDGAVVGQGYMDWQPAQGERCN